MTALISATAKAMERAIRRKRKAKRIGTAKPSLAKLKAKLWGLLAPAVKAAYPPRCYTCGRAPLTGTNHHAGHMFAKGRSHALSAFDPRNLRPQDWYCNINLGGNGAEFARRYIAMHGQAEFDEVARMSEIHHKWTAPEVQELIDRIKVGLETYQSYYIETYGQETR